MRHITPDYPITKMAENNKQTSENNAQGGKWTGTIPFTLINSTPPPPIPKVIADDHAVNNTTTSNSTGTTGPTKTQPTTIDQPAATETKADNGMFPADAYDDDGYLSAWFLLHSHKGENEKRAQRIASGTMSEKEREMLRRAEDRYSAQKAGKMNFGKEEGGS